MRKRKLYNKARNDMKVSNDMSQKERTTPFCEWFSLSENELTILPIP